MRFIADGNETVDVKSDLSHKKNYIPNFTLFNYHVLTDVEQSFKASMQLTCDENDKLLDNMKDYNEIYFNAMIFDEKLLSKSV